MKRKPVATIAEEFTGPSCARLAAFCSRSAPEVFHSIVYQPQIWSADPFDVETIHGEAREVFGQLLRRASTTPSPDFGKMLLLHGEAGSGKTHLMRAFRNLTHADGAGYFAYLQMTTESGAYSRYLLSNLITSLDHPYYRPAVETSGLMRLSTAMFEAIPGLTAEERDEFQSGTGGDAQARVHEYADRAMIDTRFADCDLDLIRALLYLQRDDPRIKGRVLKWLRCEDLAPYDRAMLGDLVPRTHEEHPQQMVAQLGRVMAAAQSAPLVLCVDQLEDMFNQDMPHERFGRIVDVLVSLADAVPTAVVIVACLEDYYKANSQSLKKSKLDRLERDPGPIRLTAHRSLEEIEAMVARRLEFLYEDAGLSGNPEPSTYPFQRGHLEPLTNLSTRNVLDNCRAHHQQCIAMGDWIDPEFSRQPTIEIAESPTITFSLEQAWNDARSTDKSSVPDEEPGLAVLLAWGIEHCAPELPADYRLSTKLEGRFIHVVGKSSGKANEPLLVALCEKNARGGGLGKQIAEISDIAGTTPVVLVRSTEFPGSPSAAVSKRIAKVIKDRGRRVVVADSDWRMLLAFRAFHSRHAKQEGFAAWQRQSRPLGQLPSLRKILALDELPFPSVAAAPEKIIAPIPPPVAAPAPAKTPPPAAPQTAAVSGPVLLGATKGLSVAPVHIAMSELKQHMAFLGGSGSGKTTAALAMIEQLLLRGVPAILLDRKGDLCRYADPDVWNSPVDLTADARLRELRDRIDVTLYTPGSGDEGRPLGISIVPDGLSQLPTAEREQTASFAAAAIGGMMSYKPRGADQILQVILAKAIEVLAASNQPVNIDSLQALVQEQDDALLNAVNGFEAKHYKKLAQDLLTLKLGQSRLLTADKERLDIDAILGLGDFALPGKTRLAIINTQFLGTAAAIEFWVSQFFLTLDRWRAKSPSEQLQAVVLLDEADLYLPAVRQPATKAPLESLLRRARSAGLGLLLATQSPGDFDYKCKENIRAWLVGRVKEPTAINKLKPMFSEARIDVAAKLPTQEAGEFYLLREKEIVAIRTERSLIQTRQVPEQRILELAKVSRTPTH